MKYTTQHSSFNPGAFCWLNTSSSTESTFWAICILRLLLLPAVQSTLPA